MKLSQKEVQKIAELARLELSSKDEEKFSDQLSGILTHIEKLGELKTEGIEPTSHAMLVPTPFRDDTVIVSPIHEKVLAQSPDREETLFRVPKVL
ncbi:MAG: Asp-tRNA(Asn)/Glu-tRNA(Gln) amidotransferase subunit GatC [bacterium]|nr:Asp-tRNA(Asn)/Glu-tRNA(Gln) amidotransferase subunit GatC [bacterium]